MEVLECLLTILHYWRMQTRALCFPRGFSASTVKAPDQDTDTGAATTVGYLHLGIVAVKKAARGGVDFGERNGNKLLRIYVQRDKDSGLRTIRW
jgi:hypothetical protein